MHNALLYLHHRCFIFTSIMLNLLPQEERHALFAAERMRFFAILALLGAGICAISILLLIPALSVLITLRAETKQALASLAEENTEEATVDNALLLLQSHSLLLKDTFERAEVSERISHILSQKGAGVSIADITFTGDGKGGRMELSGTAHTREDLINFTRALEASPYFTSVVLPVSRLAKNIDLPFSLSLSLATSTVSVNL